MSRLTPRGRTALLVAVVALAMLPVAPGSAASSPAGPGTHAPGARPAPTPPAPTPTPTSDPVPHPRPVVRTYVQHVATRDRVVFLTIDDGIVRDPAFLALVRREHLPVTVFITDSVLSGTHAAYFRALQAAGAVIENHTVSHPDLTRVSAAERTHQVCDAQTKDRRIFGRAPTLFRPPYGAVSPAVIRTALGCGIRAVVGWDAVMPQSGPLQTWNGRAVLHPGDIVLMHFLDGLTGQVRRLEAIARSQHLRFALLEHYV